MKNTSHKHIDKLLATATIASHISFKNEGFRQKNLLFILELFINWISREDESIEYKIQAIQISRYLDNLNKNGVLIKKTKDKRPLYFLKHVGLIELLKSVVSCNYVLDFTSFFFFYYFIKNYRALIEDLINQENTLFPKTLKLELYELIDTKKFLDREISASKKELKRLEIRISDSIETVKLVKNRREIGDNMDSIISQIEKKYPYELNSQKPLSELLNEIPAGLKEWEMKEGNYYRVKEIWEPIRNQVLGYLRELERLKYNK